MSEGRGKREEVKEEKKRDDYQHEHEIKVEHAKTRRRSCGMEPCGAAGASVTLRTVGGL